MPNRLPRPNPAQSRLCKCCSEQDDDKGDGVGVEEGKELEGVKGKNKRTSRIGAEGSGFNASRVEPSLKVK